MRTVVDPDGRQVILDDVGWEHIVGGHPEISPYQEQILETVATPDHRWPDPRMGRERFYRNGSGPSKWLFVVVDFGVTPARIVTALGVRSDPKGW